MSFGKSNGLREPGSHLGNVAHYASLWSMVEPNEARSIAVTGVAGFLGQRLLPLARREPDVERIVGLDVREPPRRARKLEFHRVDVAGTDLKPLLRGVDVLVHLAAVVDPIPDDALSPASTSTARAACSTPRPRPGCTSRPAVDRGRLRRVGEQPGAAHRGRAAAAEPRVPPRGADAEIERLLAEWARDAADRVTTRLRIAPVVGARRDVAVRGGCTRPAAACACAARHRRCRSSTSTTRRPRSSSRSTSDLDGAFNVAADGWLDADGAARCAAVAALPALPDEMAERVLALPWSSGLGDVPPTVVPYLVYPWVVADDRLQRCGLGAAHTNEEAICSLRTAAVDDIERRCRGSAGAAACAGGGRRRRRAWLRRAADSGGVVRRGSAFHSSHSGVK